MSKWRYDYQGFPREPRKMKTKHNDAWHYVDPKGVFVFIETPYGVFQGRLTWRQIEQALNCRKKSKSRRALKSKGEG